MSGSTELLANQMTWIAKTHEWGEIGGEIQGAFPWVLEWDITASWNSPSSWESALAAKLERCPPSQGITSLPCNVSIFTLPKYLQRTLKLYKCNPVVNSTKLV